MLVTQYPPRLGDVVAMAIGMHVNLHIVRIAAKGMASGFQLPVQFIQQNVRQQRR